MNKRPAGQSIATVARSLVAGAYALPLVAVSLLPPVARGVEIERLTTLNAAPVDDSSNPDGFFSVPGRSFFTAAGGLYALSPGSRQPVEFAPVGGYTVAATDRVANYLVEAGYDKYTQYLALWRSDGTTAGTRAVETGGQPLIFSDGGGALSYVAKGATAFLSDGGLLARIDAAADRTDLVVDEQGAGIGVTGLAYLGKVVVAFDPWANTIYTIAPDGAVAVPLFTGLTGDQFAAGPRLAYFIQEDASGTSLWVTDGTAAGTTRLAAIPAGSGALRVIGDTAYFFDQPAGSSELGLWESNGTAAGTHLAAQIQSPSSFSVSFPPPLTAAGGTTFYCGGERCDLWATSGFPGSARKLKAGIASAPLGALGANALFFVEEANAWSLWRSDGTEAGTQKVRQLCSDYSCAGEWDQAFGFFQHDSLAYFAVSDGRGVLQLWRSDGSEQGTFPVTRFGLGQGLGVGFYNSLGEDSGSAVVSIGFSGGQVLLNGCDERHGCQLWASDGSAESAVLAAVLDTQPLEGPGDSADNVGELPGGTFFTACDHDRRSLWFLPAGSSGPHQVARLQYEGCSGGSWGSNAVATLDTIGLFAADGAVWRTDGTAAGTFPIAFARGGAYVPDLERIGAEVWFVACRDVGVELWRTDGSLSGTARIAVLDAQPGYGCVGEMASIGGRIYFLLSTGLDSADLWTSDGTERGTRRLQAASSSCCGPSFHHLTPLGANLIFSLDDEDICFNCGDPGSTWRTDGTPEGTYKIEDFGFAGAAVVGEDVYLLAPFGLYRTNGERAMAVKVVDFSALPEPASADPASCPGFVRLDGTFYFALNAGNCILERSDGTQAGTKLLNDQLWTDSDFFLFDHRVFFVAQPADGNDQEIWQTTGTPAGTGVVRDLNPEAYAGACPTILATTRDGMFFVADDGVTGQQLYRVRP